MTPTTVLTRVLPILIVLIAAATPGRAADTDRPFEAYAAAGAGGVVAGERVDGSGLLLEVGGVVNLWRHHGIGVRIQLQDGLTPGSYAPIASEVVQQQRWAVFWRWRLRVGRIEPYAVVEYGYESLRLRSQPDGYLRRFNVSTNNLGLGGGMRWRLTDLLALQVEGGWWLTPQGGNLGEKRPQQWSARVGLGVEF